MAEEKKAGPAELREAFDVLFGLLDYTDERDDGAISIADEGGSWRVGVDWERVVPSWFRILSATVAPGERAAFHRLAGLRWNFVRNPLTPDAISFRESHHVGGIFA